MSNGIFKGRNDRFVWTARHLAIKENAHIFDGATVSRWGIEANVVDVVAKAAGDSMASLRHCAECWREFFLWGHQRLPFFVFGEQAVARTFHHQPRQPHTALALALGFSWPNGCLQQIAANNL
jgi:hypothetical protein